MKKRVLFLAALAVLMMAVPAMAIKAGGEAVVSYKEDVVTLDPAIGYDWQNWSIIKSLNARLMTYEAGTAKLVTDMAEDFTVSPDGLTYVFTLKKGVKFHNGREVKAGDVVYSLTRVVEPKTQSPAQGFYHSIKGYDDLVAGKTAELAGVTAPDDYTVKVELTSPDATVLHVLALNFSSVVPKEAVEKWGDDFGHHPVGAGAFKLAEWKLGQYLTMVRNPDYFVAGLPYLDKITIQIGLEPSVALLKLQRGEVDILGDSIPAARFVKIMQDPEWSKQVVSGSDLQTGYITMNVKMKPFDDVRVRQAVNMAVNKDRIVKMINNRAIPANQPLPPTMPGYDKAYKGYAFDVAKAKALLAEAGLADGFETELYCMNVDPNPRIAQSIQRDLAEIGIKVNIKSQSQGTVIAAGGEPDQAPMIWSGGMAWIADFPDPSNFYGPILGCGGAVKGGWNWSWYCNDEVEAMANKADAMSDPAKQADREKLWMETFIKIMDDAPWVPVFNETRFNMHSKNVSGDKKAFIDPVHIPFNYSYIYSNAVQ
ncbi:ABC transporter substrate-binding protein [Pseudodesulfovibrio portus]|uniref:Peptide ABC transporter substrate-binding protein n=1 Tax=Pseudodesulfovibrio portus TaxID=231439 RepID=A0ABM8AU45_9BACT|nr:ABC transporter substrate-binding protein [Pseudodesulfovibrio portus]BDQ35031.1 peptide ABC transporter substrate-binding protein [Pseudodesulfovibrio portus]